MSNKPRILILDDDESVRLLLNEILTLAGFDVEIHAKLGRVVTAAFEDQFDLIVTSITMDGMDGLNFVRGLRRKGKGVPVVMLTRTFYPGVFSAAKKIGINHVMSKPFRNETVVEVVRRLLERSRDNLVAAGIPTSAQGPNEVTWS